ncbi:MAG: transglutaminase-like domain-containing protein [Gammaproteobacteria bacterium]|nr:transglutaminase-like domain-containing protein [Gammaproteobacteria bacterium]
MFEVLLNPTDYLDYNHEAVQAYAAKVSGKNQKEQAVSIYYLVRDGIKYNPYTAGTGTNSLKASFAASHDEAYCIPKSALMVALCRSFGIPSKIGFADVINHLSTEKFTEMMGTDYFTMHGYAEIYLDDKWVKATPVFNETLCHRFDVEPLDFDGENDAIFHQFTKGGKKHMEYVVDHGSFDDMPVEYIHQNFTKHYPHLIDYFERFKAESF